jgi:hypothetical protein
MRTKLGLAAKVVIGLFALTLLALLAFEHRMHLLGWAPLLLLLLCPLMHFTMHGRHGSHGGHAHAPRAQDPDSGRAP